MFCFVCLYTWIVGSVARYVRVCVRVYVCTRTYTLRKRTPWRRVTSQNLFRACLECYKIRFQYYVYVRFLDYRYFRNILH